MDPAVLQELVDQQAIEQVFVRYFDRVDAGDAEGAAAMLAEDAELDIMTGRPVVGRAAYARLLAAVLDQYERTTHAVTNFRITLEGDRAHSVAYVDAVHRMKEDGRTWQLWARIEDDLERRDGVWVVTRHTLHGVDSEPHWDAIPREWYGGHPSGKG